MRRWVSSKSSGGWLTWNVFVSRVDAWGDRATCTSRISCWSISWTSLNHKNDHLEIGPRLMRLLKFLIIFWPYPNYLDCFDEHISQLIFSFCLFIKVSPEQYSKYRLYSMSFKPNHFLFWIVSLCLTLPQFLNYVYSVITFWLRSAQENGIHIINLSIRKFTVNSWLIGVMWDMEWKSLGEDIVAILFYFFLQIVFFFSFFFTQYADMPHKL